jgi:hypothetical protein
MPPNPRVAGLGGERSFAGAPANGEVTPIAAVRRVAIWAARFDPLGSCRRSRV